MNTHADKTQEDKSQSVSSAGSQMQSGGESTFQFVDNRPEAIAQRKLQEIANDRLQVKQLRAFQDIANTRAQAKQAPLLQAKTDNPSALQQDPTLKKESNTGLDVMGAKPMQREGMQLLDFGGSDSKFNASQSMLQRKIESKFEKKEKSKKVTKLSKAANEKIEEYNDINSEPGGWTANPMLGSELALSLLDEIVSLLRALYPIGSTEIKKKVFAIRKDVDTERAKLSNPSEQGQEVNENAVTGRGVEEPLGDVKSVARLVLGRILEWEVKLRIGELDEHIKQCEKDIANAKGPRQTQIRIIVRKAKKIDRLEAGKIAIVIRAQKLKQDSELFEDITKVGDLAALVAAGMGAPGSIDQIATMVSGSLGWGDVLGVAEFLPGVNVALNVVGVLESAARGKKAYDRKKILGSEEQKEEDLTPGPMIPEDEQVGTTRADKVLKGAKSEQGREVKRRVVRGTGSTAATGLLIAGLVIGTAATGGVVLFAIAGGIGVLKGSETAFNLVRKYWGKETAQNLGQQLLFAAQMGDEKVIRILVKLGIPTMCLEDPLIWSFATKKLSPIMQQAKKGMNLESNPATKEGQK